MTALAFCRFFHFTAAMFAFGASAFLRLCAPAALRAALSPKVRPLVVAAGLVALASALVWLALEAASMAGDPWAALDPAMVGAVVTDTDFGEAWIAHLAFASAFVIAAVFARRDAWGALALLAGLSLASLALVGHAAMQTGLEGVLHRANHAVHLLAAGAWLGGLVLFIMSRDAYAENRLRREAVSAMQRFSVAGHFVVAAILATGIVDIALISGRPPLPPTTPYRILLDAKIAVVAIMIGLALYNRYQLTPRMKTDPAALAALRRTSTAEVALGSAAVALVSVFALLDPS